MMRAARASALLALLSGCLAPRDEPAPPARAECMACHGDPANEGSAVAPPRDLRGNSDTSARGVGAHQLHLGAGGTHAPVACDECHVVPATVDAPGHSDTGGPAEVVLGTLGARGVSQDGYDPGTATCQAYCHGARRSGVWNAPRSSAEACGSCHGLPPALPHPQSERCTACHEAGAEHDGVFVDGALHVNGLVEASVPACNACHGASEDGAPPPSLAGATDSADPAVGAHQVHLAGSSRARAVLCEECHRVPATPIESEHPNGGRAEVVLTGVGAPVGAGGVGYDMAARTCTTWCHSLAGDTPSPAWNGASVACDGCHGEPPPAPHPQSLACFACHPNAQADRSFVDPALHVDGIVQVAVTSSCTACHGSGDDPAPPVDLAGNTETSAPGVGAHRAHLASSTMRRAMTCDDCHPVPSAPLASPHADGRLDLAFSALARSHWMSATYADGTCTNYCHSVEAMIRPGQGKTSPPWTSAPSTSPDCAMCHDLPPAAPHPDDSSCSTCHSNIDANRVFVEPGRHIDGIVTF